jgi:hypothetical protein
MQFSLEGQEMMAQTVHIKGSTAALPLPLLLAQVWPLVIIALCSLGFAGWLFPIGCIEIMFQTFMKPRDYI